MRQMLNPYAVALQVTPRIAIAPLIIAWAGFGYNSKIWIAAIIAFFPVYVNALTGILTVDEDAREMFRSLGASRWQTFTHLMVPGSLPIMFAGLKTAAGLSLVGAVVGEFISAERGLGVLVQQFSSQLAIADAFAVILMLMFLGLLLYGTMEWLERTTVFWLHDARLVARSRRRAARAREEAGARRRRALGAASDACGATLNGQQILGSNEEEGIASVQLQGCTGRDGRRVLAIGAGCGDDDDDGGGGGDGGGGTQEIVYNLPTPPSALFYPTLVAEELGFFEEEGVSPKLAPAAEEISATAFLDNGDADVSFADVDEIILARSKGGEHTAIFSPQHTNTAGIVVPEDSDIQDISGVEGQKVGLESEESTRFLAAMLESAGHRPGQRRDRRRRHERRAGRQDVRGRRDPGVRRQRVGLHGAVGERRGPAQHHARGRRHDRRQPDGSAAGHARREAGGDRGLPARMDEGPVRRARSTARWSSRSRARRCPPSGATRPAARPRSIWRSR